MKRTFTFLITLSLFFPIILRAESLPGSVGEAIQNDDSFSFPVTTTGAGEPVPVTDVFYRGKITKILSEEENQGYGPGTETFIQELEVEIITQPEKGTLITVTNEVSLVDKETKKFTVDDQVIVGKSIIADQVQYYVSDVYRLNALWVVLAIFIIITLLLTKFNGIRAFLGLGISFAIIVWFIVPHILDGQNPLLISLIGTTVIAATSIYIAHGFHWRTTIAFGGTLISIILALSFSYVFVKMTKLFGLGSEEAFYLQFAPGASINLQGLLLGGIIIGTLGILDDITTAQAAVVEQIHYANPELDTKELYTRGSLVGREHILSLVNTLVLAYTGASLPLLLLFKVYERPAWITLNSEIIMEEIIRMIIGSITLILAVPITTLLAARYFSHTKPGRNGDIPKSTPHLHTH